MYHHASCVVCKWHLWTSSWMPFKQPLNFNKEKKPHWTSNINFIFKKIFILHCFVLFYFFKFGFERTFKGQYPLHFMNKETKPPSGLPEATAFIHVRAITQRPNAMLIPNFFKHCKVCFTPLQDMVCLICWKTYISEFCISKPHLFQIYFFFNTFLSLLVSLVFSAFNSSAFPPAWGLYSLWFSLTHFYNPFVSLPFSFLNIYLYLILIFSWSF